MVHGKSIYREERGRETLGITSVQIKLQYEKPESSSLDCRGPGECCVKCNQHQLKEPEVVEDRVDIIIIIFPGRGG